MKKMLVGSVVLGSAMAFTAPASATVVLSDFTGFALSGTYVQWDFGTFTDNGTDWTVQANDFGGGWYDLPAPVDGSGNDTLEVQLDVNAGNVASKFNVVLIDGDGTERVYRFDNLVAGAGQTLTVPLANFLQDNNAGGVPGLDIRHDIEMEDQATAFLEYDNGATGTFITSTGEAPGTNRLEVAGERGKVVIEDDRFTFIRNEVPADEYIRTSPQMFGTPDTWHVTIPVKGHGGQHKQVLANFIDAIRDGAELIAPAEQGIHSVELANAILYSSLIGQPVDLPLDSKAFEDKLNQLIRDSRYEKKTVTPAKGDLSKSFA